MVALRLRAVQRTCERSPASNAKIKFPTPAAVTCQPVELNTSMPDCQRFESTEPSAQENDPPIRLIDAQSSRWPMVPDRNCGQTRTNNPTMPSSRPALPRPEMWWSPSNRESSTRNQSGVMATMSAARPDDTASSAYESVRLPPISSNRPTTAASAICRGEYRTLRPVAAHTASMITPAIENRTAHIRAGGMVCTAMSIPRYVEPQNRYTSPKARITIHRL